MTIVRNNVKPISWYKIRLSEEEREEEFREQKFGWDSGGYFAVPSNLFHAS
jgi:hypothetical protein